MKRSTKQVKSRLSFSQTGKPRSFARIPNSAQGCAYTYLRAGLPSRFDDDWIGLFGGPCILPEKNNLYLPNTKWTMDLPWTPQTPGWTSYLPSQDTAQIHHWTSYKDSSSSDVTWIHPWLSRQIPPWTLRRVIPGCHTDSSSLDISWIQSWTLCRFFHRMTWEVAHRLLEVTKIHHWISLDGHWPACLAGWEPLPFYYSPVLDKNNQTG